MECKDKNILFIMTKMNKMENEIIAEMEKQGASVDFFDDRVCYGKNQSAKKEYWNNIIGTFKKYDILFWIDGYSFDSIVIDKITELNPSIYKILYLWDDMKYYDWSGSFKYFDKIYSFEEEDCKTYGLNYLPLYWTSFKSFDGEKDYDLSYVGAYTEDRVKIVDSLLPVLKNYNYKINLVRPRDTSFKGRIKKLLRYILGRNKKEIIRDYILNTGIDKIEFDKITAASKCVLDMVKLTQKGFTNRSMQTIGNGIKLISTNNNLKKAPFFDSEMIYTFEPENINIEEIIAFIEKPANSKRYKYIEELELANWIKRL